MIALDTETTGLDLYHGCAPYIVTICFEDKRQLCWQWDVNPVTREVQVAPEDVATIQEILEVESKPGGIVVLQNPKFDATALANLPGWTLPFPWHNMRDTLLASHLLHSNSAHDLTSLATDYLGVDIKPYEDALELAVRECRGRVQRSKASNRRGGAKGKGYVPDPDILADWAIAEQGVPSTPSAGSSSKDEGASTWKYDTWLPLAFCRKFPTEYKDYGHGRHSWYDLAKEYANADSSVTLMLWNVMEAELHRLGLWEIYEFRLKLPPIAREMERRGVTYSAERAEKLHKEYYQLSATLGDTCKAIAKRRGFNLTLPAGSTVNNSLRDFCFNVLELEEHYNPKAKSDAPTLNKEAMDKYLVTLDAGGDAYKFLSSLMRKRKMDKDLQDIASYARYSLISDVCEQFNVLHPSLNITGSSTLRCSCSNPNAQNIKKEAEKGGKSLRYCFGPTPGREWWSLDAKNIELRIPAYESGEKDLIALFEDPDAPPFYGSQHLLNFSVVYPDIWQKELENQIRDRDFIKKHHWYKAHEYQWCKNGDFAIQYNCGEATADRAFHKRGAFRSLKSRFASLESHNQWCIKFAEKHGYIETIADKSLGHRRGYPLMCTRTEMGSILTTIPLSYRTQGTAMWWTLVGMWRCQQQLDEWNREVARQGLNVDQHGYHMTLQVHDEIVLDFPARAHPSENPKRSNLGRIRIIKKLLESGGIGLGLPTPCGVEYHALSWDEGVTINLPALAV